MAKIIKQAYTFDDVLLVPNKSEVLPKEVNLSTNLTKKIKLKYTSYECRNGYSYGVQNGYCYG